MLADAPWLPAVRPFVVASLGATLAVPVSMVLARRLGAVDSPDADRRIHATPTPRLGGLGMWLGFAAALALLGGGIPQRWQIIAVTGLITVLMAIDDILRLPWWTKLLLQFAIGIVITALGTTISFVALPALGHGAPVLWQLGWLAAPATVMWLVCLQNSINFLDGSDGVAAGVVAIVAGVCLLAAINRLESQGSVQADVLVLSGALMGCCVGFLIFNVAPARVFMGDSGSHFLGVTLGFITILGVAKVVVGLALFVPLIALGLPIGDTAFAIVRRRRAGRSVAEPDAGHLHHRLLARGLTPRETALAFYLATAILGSISLSLFGHRRIIYVAVALLLMALVALFWRNHRRPEPEQDEEGYIVVPGRRALPSRMRHRGEVD